MRSEEIIEQSRRAKELKGVTDAAFNELRQTLYSNFETCAWWNFKEMREIRRQLVTIRHIEKWLDKQIKSGKAEEVKIDRKLRKVT